ncbi:hypothetical protein P4K96_19885 [Bacillus cereus]|uniref:hypothetical protein n=1 Tax=Paenibacillus melissococcoides TaxID=2912268 RepID=UPI002DC0653E|nr:hypothetical protein [Bacillus cereus]
MAVENTEDLNYLKNQVERLDKEVFNLKSKIELLETLLIKIVDDQAISSDLLLDVDYIILKKDLSGEERAQISFFLLKIQKEHMREGKVPSLEEFHDELLQVLGVDQNEKANYPIQLSIQLLQKHIQLGSFPVGKEILAKR